MMILIQEVSDPRSLACDINVVGAETGAGIDGRSTSCQVWANGGEKDLCLPNYCVHACLILGGCNQYWWVHRWPFLPQLCFHVFDLLATPTAQRPLQARMFRSDISGKVLSHKIAC